MPSEYLTKRTLTNEERDKIEGEITLGEMQYALFKKIKGSSAPDDEEPVFVKVSLWKR